MTSAANGKEALRLLKDGKVRPDLDTARHHDAREWMAGLSGAEQRKDQQSAPIPVVVFTAYGSPKDAAEQLQAAGFLRKPLRLDELLSAIGRVTRTTVGARHDARLSRRNGGVRCRSIRRPSSPSSGSMT